MEHTLDLTVGIIYFITFINKLRTLFTMYFAKNLKLGEYSGRAATGRQTDQDEYRAASRAPNVDRVELRPLFSK